MRRGELEPQPRRRGRLAVLVRRQSAARPGTAGSAERCREHLNATRAVPRPAIDRALTRRDVPLREKTLWRMLYETTVRASEVLWPIRGWSCVLILDIARLGSWCSN